jgi:hypothetical protein
LVKIDGFISNATWRNDHYPRDTFWRKIAPSGVSYKIRKD